MRSFSACVVLFSVLCAWPRCVRAQATDASRALFDEGDRLYASGQYLAAAEAFEKSYTISGVSVLLWNIGSAWFKQYQIDGNREHLKRARSLFANYALGRSMSSSERTVADQRMHEIDQIL